MRRHPFTLLLMLAVAAPARVVCAQDVAVAAPATLAQLLQHLGEEATRLAHSLPSFTCTEEVDSQELSFARRGHPSQVMRDVHFTATLRARRDGEGKLQESLDYLTANGKPFQGGMVIPALVEGGFSRALRYFAPEEQACYRYTLEGTGAGRRIDFVAAEHLPRGNACGTAGTSGFALLDEHGDVTHLERTVSAHYARYYHEAGFAAIDFASVSLNGQAYSLSRSVLAELDRGQTMGRFEATYADCKLFSSSVTIGPAVEMPEDSAPAPPHP